MLCHCPVAWLSKALTDGEGWVVAGPWRNRRILQGHHVTPPSTSESNALLGPPSEGESLAAGAKKPPEAVGHPRLEHAPHPQRRGSASRVSAYLLLEHDMTPAHPVPLRDVVELLADFWHEQGWD